jgi:hypothetical protein
MPAGNPERNNTANSGIWSGRTKQREKEIRDTLTGELLRRVAHLRVALRKGLRRALRVTHFVWETIEFNSRSRKKKVNEK